MLSRLQLCVLGTIFFCLACPHKAQAFTSCFPNRCQNNGQCVTNSLGSSFCDCAPDYVGKYCQYQNPCTSGGRKCQNGGTCNVIMSNTVPTFHCSCPIGYTESFCEVAVPTNPCNDSPCRNGGTCSLLSLTNYTCSCPLGWTGEHCAERDHCAGNPCNGHGQCISTEFSFRCTCNPGFRGPDCKIDVNECRDDPCIHGTCQNLYGSYKCFCDKGYTGQNCQDFYIPCSPNPCLNGGECTQVDRYNFKCQCPPGFTGDKCQENIDNCVNNLCQNGGRCVDGIGTYTCQCPSEYTGKYCETDVDECYIYPDICKNGATCANSENGGYSCICVNGYEGKNCEINVDDCAQQPCLNGGTCHDRVASYVCECPPGKTGLLCHLDDACASNPCNSGAICETDRVTGRYNCSCPKGFIGAECNIDVNECDEGSPCESGGVCVNTPGSYRCDCSPGFTGPRCEVNILECESNPCYNGGTCIDERGGFRCICMPGYTGRNCETAQCNPEFEQFCSAHYGNGKCDAICNNVACGWDGLDCKTPSEHHVIIPGMLNFFLNVNINDFTPERQRIFERNISLAMKTNIKIKKKEDGTPMIYPIPSDMIPEKYSYNADGKLLDEGISIYLEIDNLKCLEKGFGCFDDAKAYANSFDALLKEPGSNLRDSWGIIGVEPRRETEDSQTFGTFGTIIGVVCSIVLLVLVSVKVVTGFKSNKRKANGTWYPEGFSMAPEMSAVKPSDNLKTPVDLFADDFSDPHPAKRFMIGTNLKDDGDSRQWTQQHLNAADIRNPGIIGALTPPQGDLLNDIPDVDDRGPMGITPLMIAASRGSGLDPRDVEKLEAVIDNMINGGADLNAHMNGTGETPLHIAARHGNAAGYNNAAAKVKKLLDHGADANVQDISGRTPLHAAVGADALDVVHVLLKNRATNLDAKDVEGTTPLILAARLIPEDMVEQLIKADPEQKLINSADNDGKTALHWAASVNNFEAVNCLLANGANRDAQDHKDETPLFLAAKEGSYEAALALLDHGANRDIQDHMDRLPKHIAEEYRQDKIISLLETHIPPAPQMAPSFHQQIVQQHNIGSPPLLTNQPVLPPKSRPKKKAKRTHTVSSPDQEEKQHQPHQSYFATQQRQQQQQPPPHQLPHAFYFTPSPDSPATPGQWSSASPQSHSDWSEGVHSPPNMPNTNMTHYQHQRQHSQHQMMQQQGGSDTLYSKPPPAYNMPGQYQQQQLFFSPSPDSPNTIV